MKTEMCEIGHYYDMIITVQIWADSGFIYEAALAHLRIF